MIAVPRSERPRVSIVICTSRNAENLQACLEALERHDCDGIDCETIVVLNGAEKAVAAVAQEGQQGATVIHSPLNVGFAAGGNLGRSAAQGEYLVLLHDDTEVLPGWLSALVETADDHPEAGAVGSLNLWPDGRVQTAGVVMWRDAEYTMLADGDDPDVQRRLGLRAVQSAGASSLLVRAATFDAAGGLDQDRYPAGWVDGSLILSIRRLGQVVLLEPRSQCHHNRGGTLGRDSQFRKFAYERNRARFLERFASEFDALPPRPEDPAAHERAIADAKERAAVEWRRSAEEWRDDVPQAPRVAGPFPPDAPLAQRIKGAYGYLSRERELLDDWSRHLNEGIESIVTESQALRTGRDEAIEYARALEAERAALVSARDEAIEYARSLEAARDEAVEYARSLEAERASP